MLFKYSNSTSKPTCTGFFLHAVFADIAYCVYWCSNNFNDTHSRIYLRSNIMFICGYLQREDICIKFNHNIHWPFQNGCWSVPGDWLLLKFWAPFERQLGWRWLNPPDGWPSLSQKLFLSSSSSSRQRSILLQEINLVIGD